MSCNERTRHAGNCESCLESHYSFSVLNHAGIVINAETKCSLPLDVVSLEAEAILVFAKELIDLSPKLLLRLPFLQRFCLILFPKLVFLAFQIRHTIFSKELDDILIHHDRMIGEARRRRNRLEKRNGNVEIAAGIDFPHCQQRLVLRIALMDNADEEILLRAIPMLDNSPSMASTATA